MLFSASYYIIVISRPLSNYFNEFCFKMTTQIPSVRLNNGYDVPMIGLGTWKVSIQKTTSKSHIAFHEVHFSH